MDVVYLKSFTLLYIVSDPDSTVGISCLVPVVSTRPTVRSPLAATLYVVFEV